MPSYTQALRFPMSMGTIIGGIAVILFGFLLDFIGAPVYGGLISLLGIIFLIVGILSLGVVWFIGWRSQAE